MLKPVFQGQVLDYEKTVDESHLQDNSTIHVLGRSESDPYDGEMKQKFGPIPLPIITKDQE